MSDTDRPNAHPTTPPRKRVVAREVDRDELNNTGPDQTDMVLSVPATPTEPAPSPPPDPAPVVDPTILGYRQRRHAHHRTYRWTQLTTLTSAAASAASVICTMVDEPLPGQILAGAALALGILATILSTRTSLSARWRGWAVAATVFALAALALTWIHTAVTDSHHEDAPPPIKPKTGI